MTAMIDLGLRLVRLLALALRLPANHFHDSFHKPMAFLRPLHYNAEVSDPEQGHFAAGAALFSGPIQHLGCSSDSRLTRRGGGVSGSFQDMGVCLGKNLEGASGTWRGQA